MLKLYEVFSPKIDGLRGFWHDGQQGASADWIWGPLANLKNGQFENGYMVSDEDHPCVSHNADWKELWNGEWNYHLRNGTFGVECDYSTTSTGTSRGILIMPFQSGSPHIFIKIIYALGEIRRDHLI